jgi:hypothetical protein
VARLKPITVTIQTYNTPQLLEQSLAGWAHVRGVGDTVFEFYCEPGGEESVALCEAVGFAERRVTVNKERLGHALNTLNAMDTAFTKTDYVVQGNNDYVPGADLLEMHAWHRAEYEHDSSVLAMTSGRDIPAPGGGLDAVWRCQLIGPLSGFHKHKWAELSTRWSEATDKGWWEWVNTQWLQSGPCYDVLFPALSRAEDIGEYHESSCFVSDAPPQEYYEVKGRRERAAGFQRWWEDTRT